MALSVPALKALLLKKNRTEDGDGLWKAGWHEVGGKRVYFRSLWEKNYSLYLEWLLSRGEIRRWDYERITFWFEGVRRGVVSYKPDFEVEELSGAIVYHEVKGWFRTESKTALKRMKKYHPNVSILLIDKTQYQKIASQVRNLIPGWE